MKATDGKYKEIAENSIEWLGSNLAQLFAEEYPHLSPEECTKVFLLAIQTNAHLFSGNHSLTEMDSYNKTVSHELDETKLLVNSFLQ